MKEPLSGIFTESR